MSKYTWSGGVDDICHGINGAGYPFFVGRVASIVEESLLSGKDSVSIDRLLKAFTDAKEHTVREC